MGTANSIVDIIRLLDRATATERLKRDFPLFCGALEQLAFEFAAKPDVRFVEFDSDTGARVDLVARELRENGFARWPAFFTDDVFLSGLAHICVKIRERSDALDVREQDKIDPDSGWHYQSRNDSGRSRAIFPPPGSPESTPAEIKELLQNAILQEVVARAFKTPVKATITIPENVIPSTAYEEQWWHIDRVYEQAKIMVLASEVSRHNGPMKLIPRSHRFEGPRRLIDFGYFREGVDFSDVPISLIKKHRTSIELCTGKPGDVIFFNTSIFHAVGRADQGERLTATVYFEKISTPRNDFLNSIHPGYHI